MGWVSCIDGKKNEKRDGDDMGLILQILIFI